MRSLPYYAKTEEVENQPLGMRIVLMKATFLSFAVLKKEDCEISYSFL